AEAVVPRGDPVHRIVRHMVEEDRPIRESTKQVEAEVPPPGRQHGFALHFSPPAVAGPPSCPEKPSGNSGQATAGSGYVQFRPIASYAACASGRPHPAIGPSNGTAVEPATFLHVSY